MINAKTLSLALAAAATAVAASGADAAVLPYSGFSLQASDKVISGSRFNLPTGTVSLASGTNLALSNADHVAFRYTVTTGSGYYPTITDNIWYGQNAAGGSIAANANQSLVIAAGGISPTGTLAFSSPGTFTAAGSKVKGLYTYSGSYTAVNTAFTAWAGPVITNDNTKIGTVTQTTSTSGSNALRTYTIGSGFTDLAKTATATSSAPITASSLTGAAFSKGGAYVARAALAGANSLTRFNTDGSTTTINGATYSGTGTSTFDIASDGTVIFWGTVGGIGRLVKTSDGVTFNELAVSNTGPFGSLTSGSGNTIATNFAPVINDSGLIAFRANDSSAKNAIFVTDGSSTLEVIKTGDIVKLADGSNATISSLGSQIDFNDKGNIVFVANYVGGGSGVYIAQVVPTPAAAVAGLGLLGGLTALRRNRRNRLA